MSQVISKKTDKKPKNDPVCGKALARGLKIFGDTWTLFIINSLSFGEKRFCELQREVGDLNPVTLTNRLKNLESQGFVDRKKEAIDKLSVSYVLTKKGRGMLPVLKKIESFAKQYV